MFLGVNMNTYNATTAKTNFGEVIDKAQSEPVLIEKSGRPYVVVLSKQDYDFLLKMEDLYWVREAQSGAESGYLSTDESEKFLQELTNGGHKQCSV